MIIRISGTATTEEVERIMLLIEILLNLSDDDQDKVITFAKDLLSTE